MGVSRSWKSGFVHARRDTRAGRLRGKLLDHMEGWMRTNGVGEVWVCADNQAAVSFYRAREFASVDEQPVYMTRRVR